MRVQLGSSRRAGLAPRARPSPPTALSPDPTLRQNLDLHPGGTQTAARALAPIPVGGSRALAPTVLNVAAGGARAHLQCQTGAAKLAAGIKT